MEQLAARLVGTVRIALVDYTPGDDVLEPAAAVAVAAVLRGLADDYTDSDGRWYVINPPRLRGLADYIEKGAGDGDQ